MSKFLRIMAGYALVCFIWGSSWAVVRVGLQSMLPLTAASLRFLISAAILLVASLRYGISFPKDSSFWKLVVILALFAFTIPYGLIYWGQSKIDSGLSSILFATFPFWVAIVAHLTLKKERLTFLRSLGIILGFIGVCAIMRVHYSQQAYNPLGISAILLGSLLQAVALIAVRKYGEAYTSLSLNLFSMSLSAVLLTAGAIVVEYNSLGTIETSAILSILYLALFGTVVTFVIYFWLVKHVSAVILSLSAFITPVIAVVVGILWLHEEFTLSISIGAALILAGIIVANGKELYEWCAANAVNTHQ